MNRNLPPFPPVSKPGSGAGEGLRGGAVNGFHQGQPPPYRCISPCRRRSSGQCERGGGESEHTGIRFARNNNTGPFAQHLDGGGSEERSSLFDLFAYDLCQGKLGHARSNSFGLEN